MGLWGKPKTKTTSTQDLLKFAEIRDGVVITKAGELRVILLVSSINFALKSEQEQTAIIYAYQNFLNSLDFPIQIVMQSKKLDLFNYLKKLTQIAQTQTNELLKIQTLDYIDFIERLIKIANIMDKKFYVTIPLATPPKLNNQAKTMSLKEFESHKQELAQRSQIIQSGLGSIGLRSAQLSSQQIIEMLYGIYNPEEAAKEKLAQIEQLTTGVVKSELEKK